MTYHRKLQNVRQDYSDVAQSDMGYLAGLLDGEGSINIIRMIAKRPNGRTYVHYSLQVRIANTDLPVLQWVVQVCGGSLYLNAVIKNDGFVRRQCYAWYIGAATARPFLEAMLPLVKIKKRQIETALEFLNLGRMFAPEVRADFYELMGQLNFRRSGNKTAAGSASVTKEPLH